MPDGFLAQRGWLGSSVTLQRRWEVQKQSMKQNHDFKVAILVE